MQASDYFQIQGLLCRYAQYLDEANFTQAAALFAQGDFHKPDQLFSRDPEGLVAYWRSWVRVYPQTGTTLTRHLVTNVVITPEGENHARASSSLLILQATPAFPLQATIVVTNQDRFIGQAGSWRFLERRERCDLSGDLSAHLLKSVG